MPSSGNGTPRRATAGGLEIRVRRRGGERNINDVLRSAAWRPASSRRMACNRNRGARLLRAADRRSDTLVVPIRLMLRETRSDVPADLCVSHDKGPARRLILRKRGCAGLQDIATTNCNLQVCRRVAGVKPRSRRKNLSIVGGRNCPRCRPSEVGRYQGHVGNELTWELGVVALAGGGLLGGAHLGSRRREPRGVAADSDLRPPDSAPSHGGAQVTTMLHAKLCLFASVVPHTTWNLTRSGAWRDGVRSGGARAGLGVRSVDKAESSDGGGWSRRAWRGAKPPAPSGGHPPDLPAGRKREPSSGKRPCLLAVSTNSGVRLDQCRAGLDRCFGRA